MFTAESLLALCAMAATVLFWCALLYFFVKLAVKHGIVAAFDELKKDGKI